MINSDNLKKNNSAGYYADKTIKLVFIASFFHPEDQLYLLYSSILFFFVNLDPFPSRENNSCMRDRLDSLVAFTQSISPREALILKAAQVG